VLHDGSTREALENPLFGAQRPRGSQKQKVAPHGSSISPATFAPESGMKGGSQPLRALLLLAAFGSSSANLVGCWRMTAGTRGGAGG